ncbi:MAG: S8 family serine peptidase, partial [Thermoanaerobaculia bacterium]
MVPAVTGVVLPQQALGADGASVIATYPSMHAVRVPLVARDRVADRLRSAGFDVQELAHVIHAPGRLIDPRREPPMDASFDAGLYLLQYAAPATPEWQAYLRLVDARVVQSLAERAVVVTARRSTAAALARLAWVEYVGPYVFAFKFAPAYGTAEGAYTLVMADTSLSAAEIAATRARVNGFVTETSHDGVLVARVQTDFLTAISLVDEPFVLGVEPYIAPQLSDERQDLGITGVSSPVGGNYLNWLAARGITPNALTQSGAIVDVADTGVDLGCYPYIGPQHDDLQGRLVYHNGEYGSGLDPQYKDNRGHGTIIAGIVGGLPTAGIDSAGSPTMGFGLTDAGNFYYGLGVAPGVRMGNTEIVNGPPVGTVVSWTTRAVSQRCNTPAAPCTYDSTTCAAT